MSETKSYSTNMFKMKYLKYKAKYLHLKKLLGGGKNLKIFNTNDTQKEFMELAIDETDDILFIKSKIKEKINNEKINEDNIIIYELPEGKTFCRKIELKNAIPSKTNQLCFDLKKSFNIQESVPIIDEIPRDHQLKTLTGIPRRPNIELLRPKIMKAVKELEDSGFNLINYEHMSEEIPLYRQINKSVSSQQSESKFVPVSFPNSSSEMSGLNSDSFPLFDGSLTSPTYNSPPPNLPPLRLESTKNAAKNERNELQEIIANAKPFEIFEVRVDARGNDQKLWLKNNKNELIEIIVGPHGKILNIQNKGRF